MLADLRYAKTDDGVHVAYAVLGDGPPLVVAPTMTQSIEWSFEDPACSRFLERLATFARVIVFDKRGTGRSDPMTNAPTLEERAEDIRAVLDACLADRAVLFGISEGGSMCLMLAATHPERVAGVITWGSLVRTTADGDDDLEDPFVIRRALVDQWFEQLDDWGAPGYDMWNPSVGHEPAHQRSTTRREQLGASPAMAKAIARAVADIDIRAVLPAVGVPVLALHRVNDLIPTAHSKFIAARVANGRYVELPGADHYPWIADTEGAINEVAEFVTGMRPATAYDRVMAAVLITDLVDSTGRAVSLGDNHWRAVEAQHELVVRRQLDRHRGRLVKTTGDGIVATFDGPSRAVRCAHAIVEALPALGLEARVGVHAGEIEVGDGDIAGIAVHIAQRIMAKAGPRQVFTSSTVKDLAAGSDLHFEFVEDAELKGVADRWAIYRAKAR